MGVDRAGQVSGGQALLDGQRHQVDQLLGVDHQQRGTQDAVGGGVDHELNDAVGVTHNLGTRHGGNSSHGLGGHAHLIAGLAGGLLT